jgi:hypothetical protein
MAALGECPPCQMGEHEDHYRVVRPAPEGGFGGVICTCKGECRDVTPDERFERLLGLPYGALDR